MKKALYLFLLSASIISILLLVGKKHITTEITINAPVKKVWKTLTSFDTYPEWNPFIPKISGTAKKGSTIEVTFKTKGKAPVVFTPTILQLEPNEILQWEGSFIIPGVFAGIHTFQLIPINNHTTKLVQKEYFTGILVPFFNFDSTKAGFKLMNNKLKQRVENKK